VQRPGQGQACEQERRNGHGPAMGQLLRDGSPLHQVSGQTEERDDGSIAGVPDEGPRGSHGLCLTGAVSQPGVEIVLSRVERVETMSLRERLRDPFHERGVSLPPLSLNDTARRACPSCQGRVGSRRGVERAPQPVEELRRNERHGRRSDDLIGATRSRIEHERARRLLQELRCAPDALRSLRRRSQLDTSGTTGSRLVGGRKRDRAEGPRHLYGRCTVLRAHRQDGAPIAAPGHRRRQHFP
jgi:hypothetical protein